MVNLSTSLLLLIGVVIFVAGFVLGCLALHLISKCTISLNMEHIVIFISIIFFVCSVIYATLGNSDYILTIFLNFFCTIIFSWLLTKRSSKEEFNKEQAELAKRSYRHINYIEATANSACKKLENFSSDSSNSIEQFRLYIETIKAGIHTCKLDWFDMLSDNDKKDYKEDAAISLVSEPDYRKMDLVPDAGQDLVNQENA